MKTLQEIQDEVAKEGGRFNWTWKDVEDRLYYHEVTKSWEKVCERYAYEVAKASLEKAAESVEYDQYNDLIPYSISRESNIAIPNPYK